MKRTLAFLLPVLTLTIGALPAMAGTAYSVQSDGNQKLYRIDLETGVATPLGTKTGFDGIEGLSFSPGCKVLYGVDDVKDRLVTCDLESGACKTVGSLNVDVTDTGLAFDHKGDLYMSTDAPKNPIRFFKVDPATGNAAWIGDQGMEVTGLAANHTAVYGLGGDGKDNLVTIDLITGAAAPIGPLGSVTLQDGGLDFDHDGTLYGINDLGPGSGKASQIFKINRLTGKATVVTTTKDSSGKPINGFEGLAIDDGICSVPGFGSALALDAPALDPLGMAVLAVALAAAAMVMLRR
jgi:hypothetical protein